MKQKICSFFGHRKIEITEELRQFLTDRLEKMIVEFNFEKFLFGSLSDFDDLCYEIVTKLKEKYSHIKRIFCYYDPRHQRPMKLPSWIANLQFEEKVMLPLELDWWYKRIYYRNKAMIEISDFVFFYVKNKENSGANKAMNVAKKQKIPHLNLGVEF